MKKNVLGLVLVCALGLTGCGNEKVDSKNYYTHFDVTAVDTTGITFVNEGKLTVAVSTDYAPFEFVDLSQSGQDKYVGADIQFAKAIAEAFNVELYIKAMDFDNTLNALDSKIADIAISGFSYTEDRASSYLFTDCYYSEGDGGQVLLIKKENASTYTTLESLNNSSCKVAAQNGALQLDLVKDQLSQATLVQIDDINSTIDSLKAGSITAIAIAETVAESYVATYPDTYAIVEEHFDYQDSGDYAIVEKTNQALATAVNKVIAQIGNSKFQTWIDESNELFNKLGDKAAEEVPEDVSDF